MKSLFHSVILNDFCEAYAALQRLRREAESRRVLQETNLRKINELVASGNPVKVEFGAGAPRGLAGWTYVDRVYTCDLVMDLTQPMLFPDDCIDEIYSSHLLEHFSYAELAVFLRECRRILKPGGHFSAAVPNARLFIEPYSQPEKADVQALCRHRPALNGATGIDVINYIAYMDGHHKYMFDEENLPEVLRVAGFRNVRMRGFDETIDSVGRSDISIYVLAEKT